MHRKKRFLAGLLSLSMIFSMFPAGSGNIEAKAAEEEQVLLKLTFDDEENGFKSTNGKAENSGTAVLSEDAVSGKALQLNGSSNYLTLTDTDGDSLLAGRDEITISYYSKVSNTSANWAVYAAPDAGTQTYKKEHYLGILENGNKITAERYNNNGARPAVVSAAFTTGQWKHVALVVEKGQTSLYIDGVKTSQTSSYALSDILGNAGTDVFYIGKANWGSNGEYFNGLIDEFTVYDHAVSEEEIEKIALECATDTTVDTLLAKYKDALTLDDILENNAVFSDGKISLPEKSGNADVTWESDKPEVIAADGTVTIPSETTDVTLTATLTLKGKTVTKQFTVQAVSKNSMADYWEANYTIPTILTAKDKLDTTYAEGTLTWSGDVVDADGTLHTDFEGTKAVTLTAVFAQGESKKSKTFGTFLVGGTDPDYILSYTRNVVSSDLYADVLAYSMHLGWSDDGTSYQDLNHNSGVLFAKATSNDKEQMTRKSLKNPYIFYRKDGSFGVIAVRTEGNGSTDSEAADSVLIFTSDDLLNYTEVGCMDLNTTETVASAVCAYDPINDLYEITWEDADGDYHKNTVTDITDLDGATEPVDAEEPEIVTAETEITGAVGSNVIPVSKKIGEHVKTKLSVLENVDMQVPASIEASSADELSDVTVKAVYNDGTTNEKKVSWNTDNVDWDTKGTYQITGEVLQTTYAFPQMSARPDPQIVNYNGMYYFISTDESGQGRIYIRKASTLKEMSSAKETLLLDGTSYPDLFTACLWAPELHEIDGNLYMFFAGSKSNWAGVQSHVMKLKDGGDPTNPSDWETPIRVMKKDGSYLYDADTQGITLDMTYFEHNEVSYVIWAQRQRIKDGASCDTGSWLYIASIDTDTWKLTSDPVFLSKPDYGWDNNSTFVDEGPYVIKQDDRILMTFSGAGVNCTYVVGMMSVDANADLLVSDNWHKMNYPILTSRSVDGEYGPGHNSYVVDEDGNFMNIYHAKPGTNGTRSAGFRRVQFDADGDPRLDMTAKLDLNPKFKTVTTNVVVSSSKSESDILSELLDSISIPDADHITGNITLPDSIVRGTHTYELTWKSDKEDVISTKEVKNTNYAATPAGVVTRGTSDTKVNLTVTAKGLNGGTLDRTIEVTVKAAPKAKEYAGYVYIHFNELVAGTSLEQIYMGISKDGLQWTALNDNQAILESDLGDCGVRDPYIVRSPEGDKFYLIATDLKISHSKYGGSWGNMSTKGSQNLIIWESEDLVNWSKPRSVDVASKINAGCAWAPESIYDEKTGEYLVFWSSPVPEDNYAKKHIYVAKTRDFYTFTEPELYSTTEEDTIDASIYKEGNSYYRLMKNSAKGYVYLQKSDELLNYTNPTTETIGDKTFINRGSAFSKIDNSASGCLETFTGYYEGPTMFKLNNEEKWCILVDEYAGKTRGYIPFFTDDLDKENSIRLGEDGTYTMTDGAKHGTVIPITQEEYNALVEKWGVTNEKYETKQQKPILTYDFEEETDGSMIKDKSQDNDGQLFGNASYRYDDEKESNVLYLDGTDGTYAQLPTGLFDGLDEVTISLDMKPETTDQYHFDFTIGKNNTKYLFLRVRDALTRTAITARGSGLEKEVKDTTSGRLNKWMNVKIVMDNHTMRMYLDNELVSETKSVRNISELGKDLISYLGKSFYNDPYYKGSYDNIMVYNRALTEKEITTGVIEPKDQITVKFDCGQDAVLTGNASIEVEKGSKIGVLPTAAKEGYTFNGWFTAKDGGTEVTAETVVTEAMTLYAHWEKKNDQGQGDIVNPPSQDTGNTTQPSQDAGNTTTPSQDAAGATVPTAPTAESIVADNPALPSGTAEDSKSAVFGEIKAMVKTSKATSNKIQWSKVKDADGYVVFGNKCNSKGKKYKYAVLSIIENNSTTSYTHTGLAKATYYKYLVQAYKMVDGKAQIISTSKTIHAATKNAKTVNVKKVKVNKTKVTLQKKGKTFKLKATAIKTSKKKVAEHRKLMYESSNSRVATVNSKGVIKAKKKGTCTIYVYAQNGVYAKVTVKVKK